MPGRRSPGRDNRLFRFVTGEVAPDTGEIANPESLAPPPVAVRREMLRLQIEAETADLQAETVALKADELARRGIHVSELGGPEPVDNAGADAEAPTQDAAAADDVLGWPAEPGLAGRTSPPPRRRATTRPRGDA